jgi:superfamily I DNA/RNA helicase
MNFRIADTFTDSLVRLTGDEQKAVKTTAFDLQLDSSGPGMSFHKLDKSKDKRFWSVRVSSDIRLIVHRTADSLLLCYVDHHDKAYAWAERRKLETHPATGAAQLVEIRERVQEIVVPTYVEAARAPAPKPALLAHVSDEELLGFGVPPEWLADARAATDDTLLTLADHLPAEAAEAVLELATGGTPRPPRPAAPAADPFEHPDALRRFRVMADVEELTRALEYPWERWIVFLHPAQRELVERSYAGPARVSGSAGTGKTIVAIHRAAFLARLNPDARVLLTTFSDPLANALRTKLTRLIGTEPRVRERIDVEALDFVARRLHDRLLGRSEMVSDEAMRDIIRDCARGAGDTKASLSFLMSEWGSIVDPWQVGSWEDYRDIARLGRRTRLPEKRRQELWLIFDKARQDLRQRALLTQADLYAGLAAHVSASGRPPYDYIVVDEAQDLSVPQLRLLSALGAGRPDALFFTGDLGQRIFQAPFSWRSLGVDIRGRSETLRINYRTSHQIRSRADRLLGSSAADVDGIVEQRDETVSVFNGPVPAVRVLASLEAENAEVRRWLADRLADGVAAGEIGVFVRSDAELPRALEAVEAAGLKAVVLDDAVKTRPDVVSIATMHLAKGLEFRAVAVMACDDEVVPLQVRIESVADEGDLEDTYETERHLLYVACTRARDHLLVTGVEPGSEFLGDMTHG